MPESSCLHIQDHESAPIRVVDLPWISVRIGRAAFCEVRLSDDDLADEVCRLYRRGQAWHLVPAGSKSNSKIVVDGRPVSVPFHVGSFCLTLRHDRSADPDWGMYPAASRARPGWPAPAFDERPTARSAPIRPDLVVEAHAIVEEPFKPGWHANATAAAAAAGAAQGQLGERSSSASVKERWETRWRAAGAELKARGGTKPAQGERVRPAYPKGFESVPLKEPRVPVRQSPPIAAPRVPAPSTFEAKSASTEVDSRPDRPGTEKTWRKEVADVSNLVKESDERRDDPNPSVNQAPADAPSQATLLILPGEPSASPSWSAEQAGTCQDSWYEMPVLELPADLLTEEPAVATATEEPAFATASEEPPVAMAAEEQAVATATEAPAVAAATEVIVSEDVREAAGDDFADFERVEPLTSRRAHEGRVIPDVDVAPAADIFEPNPIAQELPGPKPVENTAGWPSAKHILGPHRAGPKARPAAPAAPRRPPSVELTHSREPDHWTPPLWLAGPPAALFVVVVGVVGLTLSSWWAADSRSIAIMTPRLMSAEGRSQRGSLPETVAPPEGTWARTTAQHLAHWVIFLSRNEPEQGGAHGELTALLDRALQISPINPTARLARAQLEAAETGAPISHHALGLSRDAISLSWCARRIAAAGDKEGALKLLTRALHVACDLEPSRVHPPTFNDDPGVPRFLLPGEERARDIVRTLVSKNDWSFAEWSPALRQNPVSLLAAARLLKKQDRSEAETLLNLIIDERPVTDEVPHKRAIIQAARAEALALKARWRESEEQYRLAIDAIEDETVKRSWWFNLADIELRLDDENQRQTAIRAALADASDEISRRATEIQRGTRSRATRVLSSPKAN